MMYVIIGFFYIIASLFLSMHDEKLIGLDFPIKPSPKVIAINLMICVVFGAIICSLYFDNIYWRFGIIIFSILLNVRFRCLKKIGSKMETIATRSTIKFWEQREILMNLFTFILSFLTLLTFFK